ncbi:MAG: hypothetical protein CMH76_11005 [Nitrospinae bacterium]|nr:hypothetical protein [Nitrospinota bacterium]MDP7371888.1 tripartite tricarboxylate transporter TctB family protein [Nitrospinota bacterium]MDP7661810.1 tripartite tricarboxylate transporter TctB family protein [Nitrospinota bacterium]
MRLADLSTGVLFLVFSVVAYFYLIPTQIVLSIPEDHLGPSALRPDFLPRQTVLLFGFLAVFLISSAIREKEPEDAPWTERRRLYQVVVVFAVVFLYTYALELLGFAIVSPVFLAILMWFMGLREWRLIVPVALLLPVFLTYFFWYSFYVILPEGSLF